ncbi:hypothetical protein BBP40_008164 [Aspergillus hancockii]|nr:hypothetical protein BBP40_008164 [Aspergillus hancockii]
MAIFSILLVLFTALVASAPTSGSHNSLDPATGALLQTCSWDWDCPRRFLCCKGQCYRTGDCGNIGFTPDDPPTTDPVEDDTPDSPIEARWQKDCQHASECGDPNWWVCFKNKCVKRANDQHLPVCNVRRDSEDDMDNDKGTPEEPSEIPDSAVTPVEDSSEDAPEEAPMENSWQKDCRQASECGDTNWWVCCKGKCVKRANDQQVPVCYAPRGLEVNPDTQKRAYKEDEATESVAIAIEEASDEAPAAPIEARWQKDCQQASECGDPNWWVCCKSKCVKRANDQHVPVCNVHRDEELKTDIDCHLEHDREVGLSKRRYRSLDDKTNDKAEGPILEPEAGAKACNHWWDCGVTGEHQWACCNNKCLKWFPGSTPWVRPKCLKQRSFPSTRLMRA